MTEPPLKPKMHRDEQQAAGKNAECKLQVNVNIILLVKEAVKLTSNLTAMSTEVQLELPKGSISTLPIELPQL